VVNGPSWTIMTLAWVWLSYPAAASVLLRASDSGLPLLTLACMVAVFVPYTFLQPWGHPPQLVPGSNAKATAFNLLYEWPPFVAPRFIAGVAAAEFLRRRDATASLPPRHRASWWLPFIADVCLLAGWALAALIPYTGDMSPACELRKGSLQGPCLLWFPEDPGFGHRFVGAAAAGA